MKRILLGIGVVLATTTVVLGCSGGGSDDTSAVTVPASTAATDSTAVSTAPPLAAGDRYVSIGSSIASGFGIANQSTEGCGRSDRSYAHLIADRYGLDLVDVSCGAATIPNVVDSPQGDHPLQIDAVTPDTKLITIGMGGNDIVYNGTALQCAAPETVCTAPTTLSADIAALPGKLDALIAAIGAKAPGATIVVVTYPREFPATNCPAVSVTDEELMVMQQMGEALETALADAAERNGVLLADPYVEPGDHTGCAAPPEQWAAGSTAEDGFAFHPTATGHQRMAELIAQALDG